MLCASTNGPPQLALQCVALVYKLLPIVAQPVLDHGRLPLPRLRVDALNCFLDPRAVRIAGSLLVRD